MFLTYLLSEIRELVLFIEEEVAKKIPEKRSAVNYIFLQFYGPAILLPDSYGITESMWLEREK